MVEDIQVRQQIFQIMIARKIGDNKILLIKHILLMNYWSIFEIASQKVLILLSEFNRLSD